MAVLRALVLASLTTLSLWACGSDENAGQTPAAVTPQVGCSKDPRVTPFASGLKAQSTSGRLVAEIINGFPSPPVRGSGDAGMNYWIVRLTMDGGPVQGDIVVLAEMPDHGHKSPKVPKAIPNPDGTYTVDPLFLFMGGVWEISFSVGLEKAMFSLCVE
jgi:hypothetical protein